MDRWTLLLPIALTLGVWFWDADQPPVRAHRTRSILPVTVVPPLLHRSPSPRPTREIPDDRLECIRTACLAFHPDPHAKLAAALASDVKARRDGALDAIRFLGAEAAPLVPELVRLVDAGDAHAEVFDALRAVGPLAAPAVGALIGQLGTENDERALCALAAIGPEAAEARFAILEQKLDDVGWDALAAFGPAAFDVAPRLVPLLSGSDSADALLAIDPHGATAPIVRASQAPHAVLAELFGAWGLRAEIPRLLGWLETESAGDEAAIALARLNAVEAGPELLRIAQDVPSRACVRALTKLRPDLARQLLPHLAERVIEWVETREPGPDPADVRFTTMCMLMRLCSQDDALVTLAGLGPLAREVMPDLAPLAEEVPFLYIVAAKANPGCLRAQALRSKWGVRAIDWLGLRDVESIGARLRLLQVEHDRSYAAHSLAQFEELPASAVPALLDALPDTFAALGRVRQLPASCAPRLLAFAERWPKHALRAIARLEPAGREYVLQAVGDSDP